jgi:hypothetical protein
MDHFAGLDVSVKETSICIVDDTGRIVREAKVASEPEALLKVLENPIYRFKRIGLEAGPLSQWLFSALAEAEKKASGRNATRGSVMSKPLLCVRGRHFPITAHRLRSEAACASQAVLRKVTKFAACFQLHSVPNAVSIF